MRKHFLIIAAVAVAAAACSQKEDIQLSDSHGGDAIGFNVFTHSVRTKGMVVTNDSIYGSSGQGIGVFAFYQPAADGAKVSFNTRKFSTPDYMYNQQVTPASAGNPARWTYTPVKYWPNSINDQISFFAYAPYDADKTWDDLGFTTNAAATKMTTSIPVYDEKTAMKDVLWAEPLLNQSKEFVNQPLEFEFSHIMAKVAIQIGVETDAADGEAGAWNEANTDITINSIEFKGLAESYNYSRTIADNPVTTWTSSGSFDLKLTESDFQNNVIQATDRAATPANVWNSAYWSATTNPTYYKDLLASEDSKEAYLFLAPQTFAEGVKNLVITYTVTTKEDWSSASAGSNDTQSTSTIECELADILPLTGTSGTGHGFESGKAYNLRLLVGMGSVKLSAELSEWGDTTDVCAETPKNEIMPITYTIYVDRPEKIKEWAVVVIPPTGWTKTTDGLRTTVTGSETTEYITLKANPSEDNVCHGWYRDDSLMTVSCYYSFYPSESFDGTVLTPFYEKN